MDARSSPARVLGHHGLAGLPATARSDAFWSDHKDVQDLKANSRDRDEVHGPGHFEVISQEGQPGLGLVRSSLMLDHILPDGVWAGWIETE